MGKVPKGAAAITSSINEYGGNKGMLEGLKKMTIDSRRAGGRKVFSRESTTHFRI